MFPLIPRKVLRRKQKDFVPVFNLLEASGSLLGGLMEINISANGRDLLNCMEITGLYFSIITNEDTQLNYLLQLNLN